MIAGPRVLAAALLAAAGACTARDTVATSGAADDDLPGYCAGTGPPVLVDGTCSGELAEELFRRAVCGCGSLSFGSDLVTDGFDSRIAPYASGGLGGDVASNQGVDGSQGMDIGGELNVGPEGIEAGPILHVAGDLISGGQLGRSSSEIEVEGAARVAGDVSVASLSVGGTLITRPGAAVSGEITAGAEESAEVSVPPPCRCDDALDVAGVIADHALVNHDAELGLEPDALRDVDGDATLELPCGRFYLDEIGGSTDGTVLVRATGRTALFVGGNISLQQNLDVEIGPDAELDLFVAGSIQVSGRAALGDPDRPRALRIYVASGGSVSVSAGLALAGNLYAPLADLASSAELEVFGALVVNHVNGAATVLVHHDRAVDDAGDSCVD
ncbi:MAG TPA: hypothetical protein VK698_29480 [Kofleriaceae bacterium]|nr:hypothetical protein [Kofleriaceae bacterium]